MYGKPFNRKKYEYITLNKLGWALKSSANKVSTREVLAGLCHTVDFRASLIPINHRTVCKYVRCDFLLAVYNSRYEELHILICFLFQVCEETGHAPK